VTKTRGSTTSHTPRLWTIGCVVVLAIGGVAGIVIATASGDRAVHDTYFVVSPVHYALPFAAVFGVFAGWYYLFPKITGYAYSDRLGQIHFWLSFMGVVTMLLPQLLILGGMIDRVGDPTDALRYLNLVSSIGAYLFAASILVFIANMVLSFVRRRPTD
jgi:cytochrome c oxidase subunit I